MRNFGKSTLRWVYILILYLCSTAVIFFAMRNLLSNNLSTSPAGYALMDWTNNIYASFVNSLTMSIVLVILWNLLFSRPVLGKHSMRGGVNGLNWLFMLLHLALSVSSIGYLVKYNEYTWQWFLNLLIGESMMTVVAVALPLTFIVPFFIATRLFAPDVISWRFSVLKPLRPKFGLMYY